MIQELRRVIVNNVKNIPGWRTNRKIVVFECDDWGGIRMPSTNAREAMIQEGLNISNDRFDKYDTLANEEDLERLFEVLGSIRDRSGSHAVMTPLVVVANPDFEKIRKSGYSTYYYEPFTLTLRRYYPDKEVFKLWIKGIERGIFLPELHGRDHISVPFWIKELQEGNRALRIAFKYGYVSLEVPGLPEPASGFRAEFFFDDDNQKSLLLNALSDSIYIFHKIFGYKASVFVPANGILHPDFDSSVASGGIKFMNVHHKMPYPVNKGQLKFRRFISGQEGPLLTYYTRNCAFEPNGEGYRGIEVTLRQIDAAFRWGKPAIISTHRVNFIGALERSNREQGIMELRKLLKMILKRWPDAEFMNSTRALNHLKNRE